MDEITKIQLLLLAYVFSFLFRTKVRVQTPKVIFLLVVTLELFAYICLPPLSFSILTLYPGSGFFTSG